MPNEMRRMVVTHSLPRLTTAYMLSANGGPGGLTPLWLMRPIWAQYVTFEGRLYISALTNEPPATDDTGAGPKDMVKMRKPEGPLAAIHIALDHLGVRKFVLTDNGKVDPSEYPVDTSIGGWVSLPLSGQTYIHCERDGIKLRRVLYNGLDQTLWRFLWPVPQPQPSNLRLWSPDERTFQAPMRYLHINKPDTRGYSICWFYELMTICPHYPGGDPPYYGGWDIDRPKTIWAYLPVDQGETIVELWKVDAATSTVLVLTTSHGRILTLGVRPKPGNRDRAWVLQDRIEESALSWPRSHGPGLGGSRSRPLVQRSRGPLRPSCPRRIPQVQAGALVFIGRADRGSVDENLQDGGRRHRSAVLVRGWPRANPG
uniref:Uncharacterized protein n=1 Tax=Bionectria ochroleuca TaxID=29856 RepID=A0A8H7TW64_BIOOC